MITLAEISEALSLDVRTGSLTWRHDRPRRQFATNRAWKNYLSRNAGKVAASLSSSGYLCLTLSGKKYLCHRIVYAIYHTIEMADLPEQIDHINGDTQDNRPVNLRAADRHQNLYNSKIMSTNTSGYKGVGWHSYHKKWCAKIKVDGRSIHLGYFASPEEASQRREAAANELHGQFARHESRSA